MTGQLRLKGNKRWSIFAADGTELHELTSGDWCEVEIGGHWIYTTIEHADGAYYATTKGVRLCNYLNARRIPTRDR